MAKITAEQLHAIVEIQQLINDWAYELDHHHGMHIADLLTEDCVYVVGGPARTGRATVAKYYTDRLARLSETAEGVPTHRHALVNLRVDISSPGEASITFNLIYFSASGMPADAEHANPVAYADVRMECRRESDEHWRISKFESEQVFRRAS